MLIREVETCPNCGSESRKVEHIYWDMIEGRAYVGTLETCLRCKLIAHHSSAVTGGLIDGKRIILPIKFWKEIEVILSECFTKTD